MATIAGSDSPVRHSGISIAALRWSSRALVATVWISSGIFGIYVLALFLGAIAAGTPEDWNTSLPRLYVERSLAANLGIGVHFALGAVLLLLGPIQLMTSVRTRWPRFHRWTGWLYASAAFVTGVGGLAFIFLRGTIGGPAMSLGFGLYGALIVATSVQTVRHAMARRLQTHRAWAIRLFALVVGSWLYRMDYGFWFLFAGRLGHTASFDGWFDKFMIFWFYLPNLAVAELFIRARKQASPAFRIGAAAVLIGATGFLILATYFFTLKEWGPVIAERLA